MNSNIIEIISTGTIILALIGCTWWLRGKFSKLEYAINSLKKAITVISGVTVNILELFSKNKNFRKNRKDWEQIIKDLSKAEQLQNLINEVDLSNPFKKEEVDRLKNYVKKIQIGGKLNLKEARDFDKLSRKLKEEKRNDTGAILLAGLAGIALGLLISSSKE